jgi:hypothetical protein
MAETRTNYLLEEIEHWQCIYEWFKQQGFDEETKHVKTILSKITLGIQLSNPQEPSQ